MKERMRADELRLVLQHDTALDLCGLEIIERAERLIGDPLVGEWPQALTGLQFRRIGWQEEQVDALGHHEFFAAMPARMTRVPTARAWKVLRRPPGRSVKARWRRSPPSR
jgi:hypothetical protein